MPKPPVLPPEDPWPESMVYFMDLSGDPVFSLALVLLLATFFDCERKAYVFLDLSLVLLSSSY